MPYFRPLDDPAFMSLLEMSKWRKRGRDREGGEEEEENAGLSSFLLECEMIWWGNSTVKLSLTSKTMDKSSFKRVVAELWRVEGPSRGIIISVDLDGQKSEEDLINASGGTCGASDHVLYKFFPNNWHDLCICTKKFEKCTEKYETFNRTHWQMYTMTGNAMKRGRKNLNASVENLPPQSTEGTFRSSDNSPPTFMFYSQSIRPRNGLVQHIYDVLDQELQKVHFGWSNRDGDESTKSNHTHQCNPKDEIRSRWHNYHVILTAQRIFLCKSDYILGIIVAYFCNNIYLAEKKCFY
ncbi:hypothetical protein EGR_05055 [Echinococcus granulosus]|uniref:Uncharacterized protein n=1 Tax=Echinococcus granulosus TaxID=6210 RepID=W6UP48_ECHGR|nr:hypothetical protein EGR_05055 [Echinococcus granulosus]EUB60057.1 hypothetical protein EGR_05055 [Echinococcus granulosus]